MTTKKTKLIPFDYELYMNGMKPVIKDKDYEIIYLFNSNYRYSSNEERPIKIIYHKKDNSTGTTAFSLTGISPDHYNDLMLEQPIEEKTFYINMWPYEKNVEFRTLGQALAARNLTQKTLKVTYTDEDLIK